MTTESEQGNNSQQGAGDQPEAVSPEFAARRTVLKGLLATAPVVLTVTTGEALANASAFQCVTNDAPLTPPEECIDIAASDEWKREPQWVDDGTGTGTNVQKNCLLYADTDGNVYSSKVAQSHPVHPSCYNSF